MELTRKEKECRDYMMNVFIPTLHEMVEEINPDEYHKWNRNLCRQTAVFASTFLNRAYPEYDWQAWEGDFEDVVGGREVRYEHAWIFAKEKEGNRRLFLDLSHNLKERLFIVTKVNGYPKDSEEHKHMKCLSRKRLDVQRMLFDTEYLTKMTGHQIMIELNKRLVTKTSITDIMRYVVTSALNTEEGKHD